MGGDGKAERDAASEALLKEAFETDADLTGLLSRILDVVVELTGAERGFILLTAKDDATFARVVHNMRAADLPEQDPEVSQTIVRQVLSSNKALLLEDAQHTIDFNSSHSINRLALRSVVCAPLDAEAGCRGVIYLENRRLAGIFTPDDKLRAEQLAASVSRRLGTYLAMRNLVQF
jgi:GAF domain-containing protein